MASESGHNHLLATAANISNIDGSCLAADSENQEEYSCHNFHLYRRRWHMLIQYCFYTMAVAIVWLTFAGASDGTSNYFHIGSSLVNLMSILYVIMYIPGTLLGFYIYERYGLRVLILTAMGLLSIGCWIRVFGAYLGNSLSCYSIILLGQAIGGTAQPLIFNAPVALANHWFGPRERDLAGAIAIFFNPIGNGLGQLWPILFLDIGSTDDVSDDLLDVKGLLLSQALVILLLFGWSFFFFQDSPPSPPSMAQAKMAGDQNRIIMLDSASTVGRNSMSQNPSHRQREVMADPGVEDLRIAYQNISSPPSDFAFGIQPDKNVTLIATTRRVLTASKRCLSIPDYNRLCIGFAFAFGLFQALLTVLGSYVALFGFSADDSSVIAACIIAGGLVCAPVAGAVLDRYHCYNRALRVQAALCLISMAAFTLCLHSSRSETVLSPSDSAGVGSNSMWVAVLVSSGFTGGAWLATLPVAMESAVEFTFPMPEVISTGVPVAAGQALSVAFIFVLQALIDHVANGAVPHSIQEYSPGIFVIATAVVAAALLVSLKGRCKRLEFETGN